MQATCTKSSTTCEIQILLSQVPLATRHALKEDDNFPLQAALSGILHVKAFAYPSKSTVGCLNQKSGRKKTQGAHSLEAC